MGFKDFDPNDPKFKGFVRKILHSTIMAAIHSLLFKLPRIWLVGIIIVLIGIVVFFQMY